MNKHNSNKIKENSNTVRHLIVGQITTTQNLVAIKEVRHAGQLRSFILTTDHDVYRLILCLWFLQASEDLQLISARYHILEGFGISIYVCSTGATFSVYCFFLQSVPNNIPLHILPIVSAYLGAVNYTNRFRCQWSKPEEGTFAETDQLYFQHIPSYMWDEIINPFSSFNGCTVLEMDFIPHFIMDVIT